MRPELRRAKWTPGAILVLLAVSGSAWAEEGRVVTRRLERSRGEMLAVEVRIAGRAVRMAIDTGATNSMIAGELAEELGLAARAHFPLRDAAGEVRDALCAGPMTLDLGGVELRSDCLGWVPETRRVGRVDGLDGVLGFDALASADIWIDFAARRLAAAPSGTLDGLYAGTPVHFERLYGRPIVAVEPLKRHVPDRPLRMVIDSGSNAVVLFGATARSVPLRPDGFGSRTLVASYSRTFVSRGRVGRARLGELNFDLGDATLLPEVVGRHEDGVVPLALLGPVLFRSGHDEILLDARPVADLPR